MPDDIDRWLNVVTAAANSVSAMTDAEVRAELKTDRRRGRPAKPIPDEASPAATIEVWDERAYLPGTPKLIGRHEHVPGDWSSVAIVEHFGIGKHLTVYRSAKGEMRRIIQHGA